MRTQADHQTPTMFTKITLFFYFRYTFDFILNLFLPKTDP